MFGESGQVESVQIITDRDAPRQIETPADVGEFLKPTKN